jgi:hypothetical protein
MPIVRALSAELPNVQIKYVELLRTNLEEIAAPLSASFFISISR